MTASFRHRIFALFALNIKLFSRNILSGDKPYFSASAVLISNKSFSVITPLTNQLLKTDIAAL